MIIWLADNMVTLLLIFFILVGLTAFSITYFFAKESFIKFNSRHFAVIIIVAFLLGFAPVLTFGAFRAWIFSTNYNESNHASVKAQERTYPLTSNESININGSEPDASTRKKAVALKNPISATPKSIALGRDLFRNYCKPCHGKDGGGQGVMGSVPMLRLKPAAGDPESLKNYLEGFMGTKPNFDLQIVQHRTEGDIYYTLTNGGEAIMPSFRDALSPDQRWSLINYIKNELGTDKDEL